MAENTKLGLLFGSDESVSAKTNRVELAVIRYCDTGSGSMEILAARVPLNRIDTGKATSVLARRISRTIKSAWLVGASGVSLKDDVSEAWSTMTYAIIETANGKTELARLRYDRSIDKYVVRPLRVHPVSLESAKTVADYRVALCLEVFKVHNRNQRKPVLTVDEFTFNR